MSTTTTPGLLYWYTTSGVLGLLTIINVLCKIYAWTVSHRRLSRNTSLAKLTRGRTSESEPDVEKGPAAAHHAREQSRTTGRCRRCLRVFRTMWTKYVILSDLPIPAIPFFRKARNLPATELGWTLGYTAGVLTLSFYYTAWNVQVWANQTGWVAIAQIPLIIALAGKNNLISLLTGISYEKLNFLHRAAGRVCLLGSWLHTIGYIFILGGVSLAQFETTLTTWGMTSILALSLMYVLSMRWIRQRIYEFFVIAHVCLAALFLAGVIMHWSATANWIYPGIALWGADRLLRLLRLFAPRLFAAPFKSTSDSGIISLLTPSTLKLTLPTNMPWKAGQHFYVLLPALSRLPFETHPFTAAGIPKDGEVSFIVRVRDGMTTRMKEAVDAGNGDSVTGRVEGPYGESTDLRGVDGVMLFAGGSGISFAVSHLLQIIADAKAGKSRCRQVQIVWMVKSKLHLNWIQPLLLPALQDIPSSLDVNLHIHITKRLRTAASLTSALPSDPLAMDGDLLSYMEERAARPRLRSRLPSTMSWATFGSGGGNTTSGTAAVSRRVSQLDLTAKTLDLALPIVPRSAIPAPFAWSEEYSTYADLVPACGDLSFSLTPSAPVSPTARDRVPSVDSSSSSMKSASRRASSGHNGEGASPPWLKSRTVSFAEASPSSPRTRHSLDADRTQSVQDWKVHVVANEHPPGPKSLAHPHPNNLRKSSLAIMTIATDDSPSADDRERDFFLVPIKSPAEVRTSESAPSSSVLTRPLAPALHAPPAAVQMSRTSTFDSFSSFTSRAPDGMLAHGSGTATPSTPFTQLPADHTLQQMQDDPTRLSPGLEALVNWHDGRADPAGRIAQMKADLGKGMMEVMVCGPASLMDAVKKATRAEMQVGEVWRDGVRVGFHSESFGW